MFICFDLCVCFLLMKRIQMLKKVHCCYILWFCACQSLHLITYIFLGFFFRVLVGTGRACFETLRPLAYSLLAEIVHHVRADLSLSQVWFSNHGFIWLLLSPIPLVIDLKIVMGQVGFLFWCWWTLFSCCSCHVLYTCSQVICMMLHCHLAFIPLVLGWC